MASWSPPVAPLTEDEYDAEEADTVTARAYYEANRDIEPQMEEWRPEG